MVINYFFNCCDGWSRTSMADYGFYTKTRKVLTLYTKHDETRIFYSFLSLFWLLLSSERCAGAVSDPQWDRGVILQLYLDVRSSRLHAKIVLFARKTLVFQTREIWLFHYVSPFQKSRGKYKKSAKDEWIKCAEKNPFFTTA